MSRVFLLLLAMVCCNMSMAQSASPLSVEVRVSKSTIRLGDVIGGTVIIQNIDPQQSIALRGEPGFSATGGFELISIDGERTSRELPASPGGMPLAEVRSGSKRIVLAPGRGLTIPLRAASAQLFPSPGHYQLVVSYQSLLPDAANRSVEPGVLEGVQASSRVIEFDVE
jgi:hypothetical protein